MKKQIEKVGVAWKRTFKNGKEGIKISIEKKLYIAFLNTKKSDDKDPDYVIVKFLDTPQP